MKGNFSSMAFLTIDPIMQAIYSHPFNEDLIDGVLSIEKFVYYLQQDSLFLVDFARALAVGAAKMSDEKDTALMLHFAQQSIQAERELHALYFKQYRVPPAEFQGPAAFAYGSHLLERASLGSVAEGLAALLPCFWIYRQVGTHIRKLANMDNPYFRWIANYSGAEYSLLVDKAVDLMDRLAVSAGDEERDRMFAGFIMSSRYEFCFWDDAYHLRSWPI